MTYKLVNKQTGESSEHRSLHEASQFIGRGVCYISQTIRKGYAIRDAKGYEYMIYKDGEIYDYSRTDPRRRTVPHRQLCFSCKKSALGCSWSREFKPIEGWDAVPTVITNWSDGKRVIYTETYALRGCPEYEEG